MPSTRLILFGNSSGLRHRHPSLLPLLKQKKGAQSMTSRAAKS